MLADWQDGRIKLLITAAGLRLRREKPELFLAGDYLPLETDITVPGSAIAFARLRGGGCRDLRGAAAVRPTGGRRPAAATRRRRGRRHACCCRRSWPAARFRHEITGAEIRPTTAGDQAWMFLGQIFEHLRWGSCG